MSQGEKKEGEGFASREAAAWKYGGLAKKRERQKEMTLPQGATAAGPFTLFQLLLEASSQLASRDGRTSPCFLLVV